MQVTSLTGQAHLVGVNDAVRIASVTVALAGLLARPVLGRRGRLIQAITTDALEQQFEHVDP